MKKKLYLLVGLLVALDLSGCGLLSPANLTASNRLESYPKASEDAAILYQLQSNKPRTHFFVDGKEMGVARHLKIYINNKEHTVTAQAEGCIGKEEYVQPPYNSVAPLGFTYLMGECNGASTGIGVTKRVSEYAPTANNTTVTQINFGDKSPPIIKIVNYPLRSVTNVDRERETIKGQAIDKDGVASVMMNGQEASLDERGNFSADMLVKVGLNTIKIAAVDTQNNKAEKILKLKRSPVKADSVAESAGTESTGFSEPENLKTGAFGRYYALVIGINAYQFVPPLNTAENDANEVARVLQEDYGFHTKILLNATRKDILDAVNEFKLELNANDNLIIFYAGHGVKDVSAYWLPVDAKQDSTTEWIQAETLTTELKKINSNHILIVSDSCYSGEMSRDIEITYKPKHQDRNQYLKNLFSKKSRTLIASGGNEPVADDGGGGHSVFTKAFIDALKNSPDAVFTDNELFNKSIKETVEGNAEQTPQYSALRNSGHEKGSFIFVRDK